jgi:hypothetical protein
VTAILDLFECINFLSSLTQTNELLKCSPPSLRHLVFASYLLGLALGGLLAAALLALIIPIRLGVVVPVERIRARTTLAAPELRAEGAAQVARTALPLAGGARRQQARRRRVYQDAASASVALGGFAVAGCEVGLVGAWIGVEMGWVGGHVGEFKETE